MSGIGKSSKSTRNGQSGNKIKNGGVSVEIKSLGGRPPKTLQEKWPEAQLLLTEVGGLVNGMLRSKTCMGALGEAKIVEEIKDVIKSNDAAVIVHEHLVQEKGKLDVKLGERQSQLRRFKKDVNYTAQQTQFTSTFTTLDGPKLAQTKRYLSSAGMELDYVIDTNEQITPQLMIDRLFCVAMDELNEAESAALLHVPTGSSQVADNNVYDDEYEVDYGSAGFQQGGNGGHESDDTVGN
jgi:hypothetical protein